MAKTQYLNYTIHLTDAAQVATLQARYPNGILRSPEQAATDYAAPIQAEGTTFSAPCIRSPWFQSSNNYPRNVTYFTRKSGGWFGISALFGTTTRFWWAGTFALAADATDAPTTDPYDGTTALPAGLVPQRRFVNGFELVSQGSAAGGEGGTPDAEVGIQRAASRLPGGYGLALRGDQGRFTILQTALTGGGASTYRTTWERFYLRRRSTGTGFVWSAIDNSGRGIFMQLAGTTAILYDYTGSMLVIGTVPDLAPTIDEWVKVDVIVRWGAFGTGDPYGHVQVWVNGEQRLAVSVTGTGGIAAGSNKHYQTDFGYGSGVANDNNFAVDIDDHVAADPPFYEFSLAQSYVLDDQVHYLGKFYRAGGALTGVLPTAGGWTRIAPPIDFQNGTAVLPVGASGLSASDSGWTGDWRMLLQKPALSNAAHRQGRTSTTSGAVCQITTDLATRVLNLPGFLGVIPAFVVGFYGTRGLAANGSVGYKVNALAAVNTAVTQNTSPVWNSAIYRPTATAAPLAITALELIHTKGAEVNSATAYALQASVEAIGNWGACDVPAGNPESITATEFVAKTHNQHLYSSQWVRSQAAPLSPVSIVAGTYVGNGTGQDLTFAVAPHWLFIRNIAGTDAGGVWWTPAMLGSHQASLEGMTAVLVPAVVENESYAGAAAEDQQEQQYLVRISGNSAQVNALATTYQYVAICDPGMRFICSGGGSQDSAVTAPADSLIKLDNPDFTPTGVIAHNENGGSANTGFALFFRGPGHTGNQAAFMTSAVVANAMNFGAGVITIYPGLNTSDGRYIPVTAVRPDDGSTDAGRSRVVQVATWTGNGSATRDILIPGSTDRRPLFVMVMPNDNGGMHWRDPSHTGVNASRYDGANITNAITAGGINQFTVGAACNVNTVVYHAFIIIGGTVAGNAGGFAQNETLYPVEPDSPFDGPWGANPDPADQGFDPDTGEPVEEPGAALSDESDIDTTDVISNSGVSFGGLVGGQVCEVYTRRIVNRALQRIGHSKKIQNLSTETTEAAYQAREAIAEDFNQVLRDFPWPFATKYAELDLVGGTETVPVNTDWQYSYRLPNRVMFVRRIVPQDDTRRMEQEAALEYRIATDDIGGLLYTNEVATDDVPLVIEYTERPPCPAFFGDALFRDAVAWKHAATLAAALARDSKKADYCLAKYREALLNAEAPAANESQRETTADAPWILDRN